MKNDPARTAHAPGSDLRRDYSLAVGDILGQYRILRPLGRGGMGEVYLVEHAILTTRHALKLLPEDRSTSDGFVQRFHDEARVMARLKHPGIVNVTHADVADGRHYLIMDFIGADDSDEPLDLEEALSLVEDGLLPPEIVARLGRQIAEAVGESHAQGVVHRDLKPANVLLTSSDLTSAEVRVTDFGLARLMGEDWILSRIDTSIRQSLSLGGLPTMAVPREQRNSTGAILGTYEYMSPEQREGREADACSDIYALGVMLYRMVTGKRLVGRAKAASKLVPGLSPAWDDLIDLCLEENPAERPASMWIVAERLRNLEEAENRRGLQEAEKAKTQREAAESARQSTAVQAQKPEVVVRPRQAPLAPREAGKTEAVVQTREAPAAPKPPSKPGRSFPFLQVFLLLAALGSGYAAYRAKNAVDTTSLMAGEVQTVDLGGGVKLELIWVAPGSFQMGSNDGESDEKPVRTVTITPGYWLGKTEVTNGQYQQFLRESGYDGKPDADGDYLRHHRDWEKFASTAMDYPLVCVSYKNAEAFCKWLTKHEDNAGRLPQGYVYRLPTEAEWEFAARGGTKSRGYRYSGGNEIDRVAWYMENSEGRSQAVGGKVANELGLHDMSGNVWEWCHDVYQDSFRGLSSRNPSGPRNGSERVYRGGNWVDDDSVCQVTYRHSWLPSRTFPNLGFRVSLAPPVQ